MKAVAENRPPSTISETSKLVLNYSFLISITYVIIFVIAKIFNLEEKVELRFINYFMLFVIAFSALKKIYTMSGNKIDYFYGLSRTFIICALGSLWFSILFFIYLHIDRNFAAHLLTEFNLKMIAPILSICFALLSEGLAMSAIVSLALMQIFKKKQGRWARE
jgi:hypothetical protein